MKKDALVSGDGKYRYWLSREWDRDGATCLFIMLNPSTADAMEDDPTIRRCIGFARDLGYGRLEVGNLFAFRATDPKALLVAPDPVGPDNNYWLFRLCARADLVIAAWGANVTRGRAEALRRGIFARLPYKEIKCLGVTKAGHPRHPLYLKADSQPVDFA